MNPPGLDQIERTQGLAEKGPLTLALAIFVLLFLSNFVWSQIETRRLTRELLKVSIGYQTAMSIFAERLDTVLTLVAPRTRARAKVKADPTAETARYLAVPKEGPSADEEEGAPAGGTKP